MNQISFLPQIHTEFKIAISKEELSGKLPTGTKRKNILASAKATLDQVNNHWNPAFVYRWLPISQSGTVPENFLLGDNNSTSLSLGHSSRFLVEAKYALIASYTAGNGLEKEVQKASNSQQFLTAYTLNILGLLILEKTGNLIIQKAEQQAAEFEWGVSPFLSPGSVHGWDLKEQNKLARLLPLDKIGLNMRSNGVLTPFNSLTCLIGIGPGYLGRQVGNTCQVCSKNTNCQMRQQS